MPRPKKYALIWWLDSAYKDVVDLLVLPRNNREVNCTASVKWHDKKRKKTIKAYAKVLAISENRDELENIIVDSRGVINDASNKIFSTNVVQEKKEITEQEKIRKSIKNSNKRQIEEKIRKDRSIFDKENSCKEPVKKKIPNKNRLYSKNMRDHNNKQAIIENNRIVESHTFESQPYIFPTCSNVSEKIISNELDNQQIPENCQGSFENSTYAWNYQLSQSTKVKPVDTDSLKQLYNSAASNFCETYPITEVSHSHDIQVKQSDYTLTEIQNVSCQPRTNTLQSKSETSNNKNLEISYVSPSKIQSIIGRNSTKLGKNSSDSSNSTKSTKEYCMQSSSEISTLNSSDESESSEEQNNFDTSARSFAGLIPFKITKRDIQFLEFLLTAIKHSYESEAKADRNNRKTFEIPADMLKPGDNLVEISPNSGFYLSREKIAYIELKSITENQEYDWKKLVRETLLEVYGESISNFSAIGKRGIRPPISAVLFKALFNWATVKAGRPITRKAYIQCINKCASNKRKYRKKKESHGKRQRIK